MYNHNSSQEKEIIKYITSIIDTKLIQNFKLPSNKEIDIYLPEKQIGIEFDGLYWHSELYKSNDYHLQKTQECEKQGIQLIHIFEDEWKNNQDIIKKYLFELLNYGYINFNINTNENVQIADRRFISNLKENIYTKSGYIFDSYIEPNYFNIILFKNKYIRITNSTDKNLPKIFDSGYIKYIKID